MTLQSPANSPQPESVHAEMIDTANEKVIHVAKAVQNLSLEGHALHLVLKSGALSQVEEGVNLLKKMLHTTLTADEQSRLHLNVSQHEYTIEVSNENNERLFKVKVLNVDIDSEDFKIHIIFDNSLVRSPLGGSVKSLQHALYHTPPQTTRSLESTQIIEYESPNKSSLDEINLLNMQRERQICNHFTHPAIVLPYKVTHIKLESNDETNKTTEKQSTFFNFVKGQDCNMHLPDSIDKKSVADQLLDVYSEMHQAGVTQNDIKDVNLIISEDNAVHVIDWGSSIHKNDVNQDLPVMTAGCAPPEVLAPEQQAIVNEARMALFCYNVMQYYIEQIIVLQEMENDPNASQEAILSLKEKINSFRESDAYKTALANIKQTYKASVDNQTNEGNLEAKNFIQVLTNGMSDFETFISTNNYEVDLLFINALYSPDSEEGYIDEQMAEGHLNEDSKKLFENQIRGLNAVILDFRVDAANRAQRNITPNGDALKHPGDKEASHLARVKSDSYQLGIVLQNLFLFLTLFHPLTIRSFQGSSKRTLQNG